MKRDIKKRKSNLALDLSLHKNYKVSKQNKFGNSGDKKDSQISAEGDQLDTYKEGEEYDLSLAEIKKLKSQGYDIDLGYNINDEVDIDPSDIQTLRELDYEFDII